MTDKLERFLAWLVLNLDALLVGSAVALGLVGLMLLLRAAGRHILANDPNCLSWRAVIARVLAKTSVLFMAVAAVEIVVNYAQPPARIERLFDIAFVIAAALQGAVWGRELILGVIGQQVGDEPNGSTLANAMGVIRVLISVALFGIALVVILDNLGVNVTALVAGLGIGGIAIGLAAQGIFSDLFAALAILFDRPFRRGDTIRFDQTTGTVEKIGLKTTRMRSLTGEMVIMANTKLLEREIRNLAAGDDRQETLRFGLVYQTPPDKLEQVPVLARAAVEGQPGCRLVRCVLVAIGPSSLDHELIFIHEGLDAEAMFAKRAAIIMALLKGFAAEGIQFAYPTQTTFTAAPDGTLVMPFAVPAGAGR
ncbi:MAG: Potassium efflux system KefA protein / Small-conductance mechanosensitive channel [uncultured Sphingomonas sp.]|uniref:Potassium efflux system KefA protein / Small-conductance mechanosensitive channel n=1 Tax=uncultured Sphingomonas sp. TaxID=158754 RepID=A0A6J4SN73_9SPHN|nr:mechanosensitive ion channel domain-containing protein [uncultured Sphingomonas sp.]CAA9497052.1 MAG: Potassium efflux system KefA protein / Small-conductance mechanosensitive channel [uncultured Sphingomonas sp.]